MLAEKLNQYTKEDYYALPEGTHAELINGTIYDMSPAPLRIHQEISSELLYKIKHYIKQNNGNCKVYPAPFDVELSDDTVVQPDISVICDTNKLTDKGCTGAPDWIVEITSSNAVHDYGKKLVLYKNYGVKEYWIVDPKEKTVMVYIFNDKCIIRYYHFTDSIPVGIYNGKLEINIDKLLE